MDKIVLFFFVLGVLLLQCQCYPLLDTSSDNDLAIVQDSCTSPFPISSSFPIYGVSRSSYIISSSFIISFDVSGGCDTALDFGLAPISAAQNAMVSPFYADWDSTNLNSICELISF